MDIPSLVDVLGLTADTEVLGRLYRVLVAGLTATGDVAGLGNLVEISAGLMSVEAIK